MHCQMVINAKNDLWKQTTNLYDLVRESSAAGHPRPNSLEMQTQKAISKVNIVELLWDYNISILERARNMEISLRFLF